MDEDVGTVKIDLHALRIRYEVGRQVALVELHALHHVESGLDALGFFHRDGAVLAHLVHGLGDDIADFLVPVGRNGSDLRDFLAVGHLFRDLGQLVHDGFGGLQDSTLEADRIGTRSHVAKTFLVNGLGQHGGGGGSVPGYVGGLAGDLADELGSHVFVGILKLDLLGHRDTVLGDGGGAEFLVEDHVASGRSQGGFHRGGQFLHPAQERVPGGFVKLQLLGRHCVFFRLSVNNCRLSAGSPDSGLLPTTDASPQSRRECRPH